MRLGDDVCAADGNTIAMRSARCGSGRYVMWERAERAGSAFLAVLVRAASGEFAKCINVVNRNW